MKLNWSGSSLILSDELLSGLESTECRTELIKNITKDNGVNYLSPWKTNIFIADEERVRQSKTFREIIKYYETKVKPSEVEAYILRVSNDTLLETKFHQVASSDRLFSSLLGQVYINLPGISSISGFPYSIIRNICDTDKANQSYLSFLLEFISLCSLSTRVSFDDNSGKYIFQIGSKIEPEFQNTIHLETDWLNTDFFKSNIFSTITGWVLDDKGIPNGENLRRHVAQNYLLGFEESSGLLQKTQEEVQALPVSLDNMFESVLNTRSEKYIQKITKMRDEYIDTYNQYSQILTSVNTQTVSSIFALTAASYGIFLTNKGMELPLSFPGVKWILSFFIITTLFILVFFIGNLCSLRNSRRIRRKFYSEMLGVTDETLAKMYTRINPSLPRSWLIPLILLVLIIVFLSWLFFFQSS